MAKINGKRGGEDYKRHCLVHTKMDST